MASSESNKPSPRSPPVLDSPIFGYVSSLSPIKPVNARPTVQVYENIDVPSPQLVFKTPNFSRPRHSSLSERSEHLTLDDGTENLSPGYANNTRELPESTDISRASLALPGAQLSSYCGKECASGDRSPQSCPSPSNCVDVFLADPSENGDKSSSSPEFCLKRASKDIEGDNTTHSENQTESFRQDLLRKNPCTSTISVNEQTDDSMKNSASMVLNCFRSKLDAYPSHSSESDSINAKESTAELHATNMKKYTSRTALMSSRSEFQMEEDLGSALAAEAIESNKESITELGPVSKNLSIYTNAHNKSDYITQHENNLVYQNVDHSFVSKTRDCEIAYTMKEISATSGFLCHGEQELKLQTAKAGQSDELDCTPQLHPGSPRSIQTCNNPIGNSVQMSSASTGNHILYDLEDSIQHQRGKRKRLQFEAAENLRISNRNSCNYTTEVSNLDLPIASLEAETVNASNAESITKSSHKQVIQSVPVNAPCRILVKVVRSERYKESSVTAPRPAGIGLHLNSIGSAASMNCNSNMELIERNSSVQEEKALSQDIDQVSEMSKNCPASMSLIDPAKLTSSSEKPLHYAGNDNNEEEHEGNQAFQQQHSSASYLSPLSVKPLNNCVPLKHIDHYMTPCIMKSLPSEEANKSEESTQTSPRKKRKKALENDGHKRCNCKRSKCLKLYCDCFAAGSYCSEACACQDCSNRVECEGTVRETRQQIESRNPLAFAPKVVLRVSDPPKASGDNKRITPTSARHKRGCNCKKSLCLKKYCECFQAGVGCSLGCRCEGCKNTFGTKDGCEISELVVEHKRHKEGGWERDLSDELEGIEVKNQIANTKQCHSRLSPLTPLIQNSTGNDVSKPQFPSSYFPSPGTVASVVRSYDSSGADLDAMQSGRPAEDRSGFSSFDPNDPENIYHSIGKPDSFSPGWEGFPEICNLSPLLKTSPCTGGSSYASKTGDQKTLQMKLFQGRSRISLGSVSWRSSPITPLPQFGENKFLREPDSDSGLHCNLEDDTPEILKEIRSPIKSVTAATPNQKRVSPPHQVLCGSSANSPSGLRSGRKYILQSVPAFPSLSPYSKSDREDGT